MISNRKLLLLEHEERRVEEKDQKFGKARGIHRQQYHFVSKRGAKKVWFNR